MCKRRKKPFAKWPRRRTFHDPPLAESPVAIDAIRNSGGMQDVVVSQERRARTLRVVVCGVVQIPDSLFASQCFGQPFSLGGEFSSLHTHAAVVGKGCPDRKS